MCYFSFRAGVKQEEEELRGSLDEFLMWFMSNSHFCKTQTTRLPSETKKKLIATVADTGGKYIKNSASNSHKTSVENRDIPVAQTIGSCEARTCKRSEFFKEDPTLKKTVDG